ncbi:MAG: 1-aminocyclopropane-1-carboxylate deaminase/D-cysteine desulfhydrase, partial [Saprospiraceae bacterium]
RDYEFGGFAKKNALVLDFARAFQARTGILLDPVYTAKMLYGVWDLLAKGYFPAGSTVVAVHTGGLQGWAGFRERYGEGIV